MRIPIVLTNYKTTAGAAVVLMVIGTVTRTAEVRAWGLLLGITAATLFITAAIRRAAQAVKVYVRTWSLETFEHGIKQGIDLGREMEAAERLIASARDGDQWRTSGS